MIIRAFAITLLTWVFALAPAHAADRGKLEAFMKVTGFDVALASLRTSAHDAPAMLGLEAADFGISWSKLADELFDPDQLTNDALDILEQALRDDVLDHAAGFYASDLGQRLVMVENESHFADDEMKRAEGMELVAQAVENGSTRLNSFKEMSGHIGSIENSIAAFREVQVRFLMAAMASGIWDRDISEEDLRAMLSANDDDVRPVILEDMLVMNAWTYRDFSDADIQAYADALATDEMKEVYELMNAIQYTLQADRYEIMATKMAQMHPSQEL